MRIFLSTSSRILFSIRHSTPFRDLPHEALCKSLSPLSIILFIIDRNGMRPSKGKTGSLWLRGNKARPSVCIDEIPDLGILKREAKKIEIMTRMDKRAKTN